MHPVARRILEFMLALCAATSPMYAGNCSWNTQPAAIPFNTYSVFDRNDLVVPVSFSVHCTPNTIGTITLSRGGSGSYTPRLMSGPQNAEYNIFLDQNGQQIWGDLTGGSTFYAMFTGTAQTKDFNGYMYGIVPALQDLPVGNYSDTVYVTLSWTSLGGGGSSGSIGPSAISVSMNVIRECRVDSFNLNFGDYNPFATANLTKSGLLKVYCSTNSAPLSVVLTTNKQPPEMTSSSGDTLLYAVSLGTTAGSSTSSLLPISGGFSVNGSITAGQDVPVGSYSDSVLATVNY